MELVKNEALFPSEKMKAEWDDIPYFITQYVHQQEYAHVHHLSPKIDRTNNAGIVSQLMSYKAPAKISRGPFLFYNHINGGYDVIFQDVKNQLYFVVQKREVTLEKTTLQPHIRQN
jgi:hypothetical protein